MVQYQYFTIIAILNFLFFVNHFLIRHLRQKRDKSTPDDLGFEESESRLEVPIPVKKQKKKSKASQVNVGEPQKASKCLWLKSHIKAFAFGLIHKEKNSEIRFLGWRPLKFNTGKITTSLLLITTVLFLSQDFLKLIGLEKKVGNVGIQLCETPELLRSIQELNQTIDSPQVMNLEIARKQLELTQKWKDTLKEAVGEWGEDNNNCRDQYGNPVSCVCRTPAPTPGTFTQEKKFPDWLLLPPFKPFPTYPAPLGTLEIKIGGSQLEKYGPYFPGMCQAARQNAITRHERRVCTSYMCVCGEILGTCWGGATRHCFDNPVPCEATTPDADVIESEEGLLNARRAEQRLASQLRQEVLTQADNLVKSIKEETKNDAEALFKKILFQVDVAGTCYVLYVAMGLFFPCALKLFRSGMLTEIKQTVFGAGKYTFITVVVAAWWGSEYFLQLYTNPELALYYKNVLGNPCFADPDFLEARQNVLNMKCEEMMPLEDAFNLQTITLDNTKLQFNDMRSSLCCEASRLPELPIKNNFNGMTQADFQELGFTEPFYDLPGDLSNNANTAFRNDIMFLKTLTDDDVDKRNFGFLGSSRVCIDGQFANQVMAPPDSNVDWVQVWIGSGLLATFLVKISLANFCIALLYFADPISKVGGKYEYPPKRFQSNDQKETLINLKQYKESTLKTLARRSAYIWGTLANLCLLNLALSSFGEI